MLEYLIKIDQGLFLFLNKLHSPFWDYVMFAISGKLIWLPLYLTILGHLLFLYRKKAIPIIISIAILIGLADLTASKLFKPNVKRYRPTHEISIQKNVHTVNNYKGGTYGYFSSHASITFVFASFFISLLAKKKKYYYVLLPWAIIVSYSRIYLGVHYPLDIISGAFCGISYSYMAFKFNFLKKLVL